MAAYVRWVDTLFSQLANLDAERRWKKLKEDYVILQAEQAWLEKNYPMNPK